MGTGRRVLMVAYHFPPSASVAAHRPHKFARYLPSFDWQPSILCRKPDRLHPVDSSFVEERQAALEVKRLSPVEPLRWVSRMGRGLHRILAVPDENWGWGAALLREIPRRIRQFRPDLVYVSSVPNTSLVAASLVVPRMGIPLVLDFHNEWTGNMYYDPPTPLHDRIHHRLERRVVESADGVVTLNPVHTRDWEAKFPGREFETAENGFESSDYGKAGAPPRRERPVLLYAGAVYGYQSPVPLLRALAEIRADIEVRILGDPFAQFPAADWPFPIRVERNVPHRELPAKLAEADAFFLVLMPEAARQLPAKLYEYMAAGRPTLALVPSTGIAAERIRETGCGVVIPSERPERWTTGIRAFLDGLKKGGEVEGFRREAIQRYDRRAQTERLAGLFDRVMRRS